MSCLDSIDFSLKKSSDSDYMDYSGRLDFIINNYDGKSVTPVSIDAGAVVRIIKDYFLSNIES